MQNEEIIEKVENISSLLVSTLARKNADYGNSFSVLFERIGMPYAYGHLAEKLERVWSLMNKKAEVHNESMKDSLLDLAGYALLTLAHMQQEEHMPSNDGATPSMLKEGDSIFKPSSPQLGHWKIQEITDDYILITNDDSRALILPKDLHLWEKV